MVLDIGCAEGYYAVVFAMCLPNVKVIGYDIDPVARESCRQLSQVNHVESQISISGSCDDDELRKTVRSRTVLVCDCEGDEWHLLDPNAVPTLSLADMLVERHCEPWYDCQQEFENRFASTNHLRFVTSELRNVLADSPIGPWTEEDRLLAFNEFRVAGYQWVWAKAKSV